VRHRWESSGGSTTEYPAITFSCAENAVYAKPTPWYLGNMCWKSFLPTTCYSLYETFPALLCRREQHTAFTHAPPCSDKTSSASNTANKLDWLFQSTLHDKRHAGCPLAPSAMVVSRGEDQTSFRARAARNSHSWLRLGCLLPVLLLLYGAGRFTLKHSHLPCVRLLLCFSCHSLLYRLQPEH
jgi:hypothetical protein